MRPSLSSFLKNVEKGVQVTEVKAGSAVSRAGIREGDIIREINRQVVRDIEDFQSLTRKFDSDDRVLLTHARKPRALHGDEWHPF